MDYQKIVKWLRFNYKKAILFLCNTVHYISICNL